jgi:hypothetical protein
MKLKVFFTIAIRLIVLFIVGILGTYLPEILNNINPKILGDFIKTTYYNYPIYSYGTRHYWLNTLMFFLFLLSCISFIMSIIKIIKKEYNILN